MIRNYSVLCLFIIWICFTTGTDARKAIVGGIKADGEHFPYHVSLQTDGKHFCSGAIVTREFVITAAHCVVNNGGDIEKKRIFVLAGSNDLRKTHTPATYGEVQKVYVPVEYLPIFVTPVGDIALLKMKEPLELSVFSHTKNLSLPKNSYEDYYGKTVKVSGYGWTWAKIEGSKVVGGNHDTQLRYIDAVVLRPGEHGYPSTKVVDKQILAKAKQLDNFNPHGACEGDGGAPLVYNGRVLIGILSGFPFGCSERDTASTYTRVSHYLTFIRNAKADKSNKYIRELELPTFSLGHTE